MRQLLFRLGQRPGVVLGLAMGLPLLLAIVLVLYTYSPLLPGSPPRSYPPLLFWLTFVVGVGLLQALPFGSTFRRVAITLGFGVVLWIVVFAVSLYLACSYGDCL